MAEAAEKDLRADARNFCDSLANVFMMKRRDPQTQHLLEKSKGLIESLIKEKRIKSDRPAVPPKPSRAGSSGMGQLWVKLDELKRENDELRKKMVASKKSDDKGVAGKASGPGDVIISELHRFKSDNESLKTELDKSYTNIKELEKVNLSLQDEYKRTRIAQELAQESLEKIRKERKSLESSLTTVKTENDSLKLKFTNSVKPMKRVDSRLVENINEKCRPSTVAVQYSNLESQEWVDAKESLEEAGYDDEVEVTHFLADIITMCYTVSSDLLSDVENGIGEIMKNPCKMIESSYLNCAKEPGQLPEELLAGIKDCLRQNTEHVDVEPLVDKCKDRIVADTTWSKFEGILSHKHVHRYIEQCSRITWQMVAQHTPMWLDTSHTCFDDEIHKLWWSCDKSEASVIQYFVWPALYDSKNGTLLVKGCVYTTTIETPE